MFYKNRKVDTQKSKAYEFYNSYKWEKVLWTTFYYRVRLGGEESWEDKIKIKQKEYHRRNTAPKGKWAKEFTWYLTQPEPKATKSSFRNRLNLGYAKEKAILMWDERQKAREEKWDARFSPPKAYVPPKKEVLQINEDDFMIKITLSKEEAKVIREEYEKMISEIEDELIFVVEKTEISELNRRLESLYKELQTFNLYNPE